MCFDIITFLLAYFLVCLCTNVNLTQNSTTATTSGGLKICIQAFSGWKCNISFRNEKKIYRSRDKVTCESNHLIYNKVQKMKSAEKKLKTHRNKGKIRNVISWANECCRTWVAAYL
jgi:hypothetical protein